MKLDKVLIGTNNQGKFTEISRQFERHGIKTYSLKDLCIEADYEEIGKTFEENALGKAKFYYNLAQMPTIADDSGLSIDALNGEPGVKSRRWPGYEATDEELLEMLFDRLKDVPKEKRTASFRAVSVITNGNEILMAQGESRGYIADKVVCEIQPGIPWSAVFYPDGYDKVYSQLTVDEKNSISHRGKALENLIKQILENE